MIFKVDHYTFDDLEFSFGIRHKTISQALFAWNIHRQIDKSTDTESGWEEEGLGVIA
jgi:hypothetical protein